MQIVIAGGSGFLGTALSSHLAAEGHHITVLTRGAPPPAHGAVSYAAWSPDGSVGAWARTLESAHAVVNLAGESIAARRWSPAQKDRILQSRLLPTRSLAAAVRAAKTTPPVFVSASAVGYYGDRGDETVTEASPPGSDFLSRVCQEWEASASSVSQISRVALIRTGLPLDRGGGVLPKMVLPFRMFVGGPMGSGRQYMPWIHLQDWCRLVALVIQHEGARGPVNITGPRPITNAEFAKALGRALHRPSFMPAPAFALRIALGEMADALLLGGQRALPVRAADLGFSFRFPSADEALSDIFRRGGPEPRKMER